MKEWLQQLANPSFMPHGHCYLWQPEILWLNVLSDIVIGIAYFTIPVVLVTLLLKRKEDIPHANLLGLFGAFILLCGTTHFVGILVVWYPFYEFQGWVKLVTALVSIFTAIRLVPLLPDLLDMPDLKKSYGEASRMVRELTEKNQELQAFYDVSLDREERIMELKEEVNQLLENQDKEPKYTLE